MGGGRGGGAYRVFMRVDALCICNKPVIQFKFGGMVCTVSITAAPSAVYF